MTNTTSRCDSFSNIPEAGVKLLNKGFSLMRISCLGYFISCFQLFFVRIKPYNSYMILFEWFWVSALMWAPLATVALKAALFSVICWFINLDDEREKDQMYKGPTERVNLFAQSFQGTCFMELNLYLCYVCVGWCDVVQSLVLDPLILSQLNAYASRMEVGCLMFLMFSNLCFQF